MPRVCIVELRDHPAPGALERGLLALDGFVVRAVLSVPDPLDSAEVLVLNSIPSALGSIPEDRILRFARAGGGVVALHDAVYPYGFQPSFIAACGIRNATGAMQLVVQPDRQFVQVNLARSDPANPMTRFPVRPTPEGTGHPILEGVREFELAEEVWAQNLAPGVRPLMMADVGDRVFAPERFQRGPLPVAACLAVGDGRLAWCSLGHFADTYRDPNFLRVVANAIRWVSRETNEREYEFDLFLSYSSQDRDQARAIVSAAEALGLTVFQDEKNLAPGAVWAEEIRHALFNSREMAVLASPTSLVSEWVQTEWGAAWAMERTITPILLMLAPTQLPDRLRQRQAVIYGEHAPYLEAVRDRARG
jgi:hypothetical protein